MKEIFIMKTKKEEYQEKIIERSFLQVQRAKILDIGIFACFIISMLIDIISRLENESDHFKTAFLAMGFLFFIVYSITSIFFFFMPSWLLKNQIEKRKKNLLEIIETMEKEKNDYWDIIQDSSRMIEPEFIYLKKIDEIQEQIWNYEFELRMLDEKQ